MFIEKSRMSPVAKLAYTLQVIYSILKSTSMCTIKGPMHPPLQQALALAHPTMPLVAHGYRLHHSPPTR